MSSSVGSETWRQYPLILLSGMGADERVFLPQILSLPNVIVPKWIQPKSRESMAAYARRFAQAVDPHQPCFVGGASFGGMLAVEMARYLDARCVFLIGSVASPRQFPPWLQVLCDLPDCTGFVPFNTITRFVSAFLEKWESSLSPSTRGVLRQAADADPEFLRWASSALLKWKPPLPLRIPIHHIHGANDQILPVHHLRPGVTLRDGGHVISLSHGPAVNRFLREMMSRHGGGV